MLERRPGSVLRSGLEVRTVQTSQGFPHQAGSSVSLCSGLQPSPHCPSELDQTVLKLLTNTYILPHMSLLLGYIPVAMEVTGE